MSKLEDFVGEIHPSATDYGLSALAPRCQEKTDAHGIKRLTIETVDGQRMELSSMDLQGLELAIKYYSAPEVNTVDTAYSSKEKLIAKNKVLEEKNSKLKENIKSLKKERDKFINKYVISKSFLRKALRSPREWEIEWETETKDVL